MKAVFALIIGILTATFFAYSSFAGPDQIPAEQIPDKNVAVSQEAAVPFSWSGFYIGANLGGNWIHSDFGASSTGVAVGAIEDFPEGETDPGSEEFTRADEDFTTYSLPSGNGNSDISFIGGGQLGYQRQFGHFVIGVEGDFDGATGTNDTANRHSFVTPLVGGDNDTVNSVIASGHRTEVDWQASGRGRLGYGSGRFLLYATGGAAFAQVTSSARDMITSNVFDTPAITPEEGGTQRHSNARREDSTRVGWTAGAGADYALCRLFSLGIEYRHNDFGSETLHSINSPNQTIKPGNTGLDLSSEQVTMRINFLFGRGR